MLRTLILETDALDDCNSFDYFLQPSSWATNLYIFHHLTGSLCQLMFGRDIIQNVTFREAWKLNPKKEIRTK